MVPGGGCTMCGYGRPPNWTTSWPAGYRSHTTWSDCRAGDEAEGGHGRAAVGGGDVGLRRRTGRDGLAGRGLRGRGGGPARRRRRMGARGGGAGGRAWTDVAGRPSRALPRGWGGRDAR